MESPSTIETILLIVAATSAFAPFPYFVAMPDDVEEKMTENDKQGLISFVMGLGLLGISYLTATDVWHLVYNTASLTGVVATWSATVGGLLFGYGGIVMLPNPISRKILQRKYLKKVYLPIVAAVAIIITTISFL